MISPCDECSYCDRGYPELCEDAITIGLQVPGAIAEYLAVDTEVLCVLPDGVSDAEGAGLQPLASAVVCVHEANISTGDVVIVVRSGVMGAGCGQLAQLAGNGEVYAVDIDPEKVTIAEDLGQIGIHDNERDPVAEIRDATGGVRADIAFAAVGGTQDRFNGGDDPVAQAFRLIRRGGRIVQVGSLRVKSRSDHLIGAVGPSTGRNPTTPGVSSHLAQTQTQASGRLRWSRRTGLRSSPSSLMNSTS